VLLLFRKRHTVSPQANPNSSPSRPRLGVGGFQFLEALLNIGRDNRAPRLKKDGEVNAGRPLIAYDTEWEVAG